MKSKVASRADAARWWWMLGAVLWTVGVFAAALQPPSRTGWLFRLFGDKVIHGTAFALGGLLWIQAVFGLWRRLWFSLVCGAVVALGVGVVIEELQRHVPGRRPDPSDLLADAAGVLLVVFLRWSQTRLRRGER